MELAAEDVSCYDGSSATLRLLRGDAAERAGEQPLVPLRRLRRHRHRLLRRQHRGARRRPRRARATTRSTGATRSPSTSPASPRPPGPATRSSTRSSPTASATATRRTTRRRATSATTSPVTTKTWNAAPRGVLPQLRGRGLHREPARPGLLRRRPEGRAPEARLPAGARRDRDLLQPDLLGEVEPPLRHRRLRADRPCARRPEGVREARQAGRGARDPRHPRRRLQPHVVRQLALRPLRAATRRSGACESTRLAVPELVHVPERERPVRARPTTSRWFGFDSIPTLLKTNPAVQDYFVRGPNSIAKRWLDAGAGGWRMDVSGDASFPDGYWEAFRQVVEVGRPGRADDLARPGRRTRRCCARSAATASTRR